MARSGARESGSAGVVVQPSEDVVFNLEVAHVRTLVKPGPAMGSSLLFGYQFALGFQLRLAD